MFEYDPEKSAANLAKHGIDFEAAQDLWLDVHRLIVSANSTTEPRYGMTAVRDGKHWTAFATQRGDLVRIISVRRARDNEVKEYEDRRQAQGDQR